MKKAAAIGMALLLWAVSAACASAGRIRPAVWAGVVGYAAIAFVGGKTMADEAQTRLTDEQGQALVKLARLTLMHRLGVSVPAGEVESLAPKLKDPALQRHSGTFVTLKIGGRLRGCIGSLSAAESIVDGVRQNAVNAAMRDPRFAPLSADELEDVDIEVSVLTQPRPLNFDGPRDLISRLQVGKDGVIIRQDTASATFLPQVWEQLPHPEDFLSQLCLKAGLSAHAWKESGLEVMTYRVQYFEEKR